MIKNFDPAWRHGHIYGPEKRPCRLLAPINGGASWAAVFTGLDGREFVRELSTAHIRNAPEPRIKRAAWFNIYIPQQHERSSLFRLGGACGYLTREDAASIASARCVGQIEVSIDVPAAPDR